MIQLLDYLDKGRYYYMCYIRSVVETIYLWGKRTLRHFAMTLLCDDNFLAEDYEKARLAYSININALIILICN